jgi:hypothetical protein
MPVVKELCGLDNVERYLESLLEPQMKNQSKSAPVFPDFT